MELTGGNLELLELSLALLLRRSGFFGFFRELRNIGPEQVFLVIGDISFSLGLLQTLLALLDLSLKLLESLRT